MASGTTDLTAPTALRTVPSGPAPRRQWRHPRRAHTIVVNGPMTIAVPAGDGTAWTVALGLLCVIVRGYRM